MHLRALSTVFCLSALVFSMHSFAGSRDFKVSTFNVEWYGLGGSMAGSPQKETRDANLKKVIDQSLQGSDVIVFQEVVSPTRLAKNLLPAGWKCRTYKNDTPKHQFVVMCAQPDLKFISEPSDNNDIIDEVADIGGKARPALHLIVGDKAGTPLFRMIGVHLKAFPTEFKKREDQAKSIGAYLKKLKSDIPVIITGDFNTYEAKETGQKASDAELLSAAWKKNGLTEISGEYNTYKTLQHQNHFDRFWVTDSLNTGDIHVLKYCQLDEKDAADAKKITWYNENVSDHCPVSLEFQL